MLAIGLVAVNHVEHQKSGAGLLLPAQSSPKHGDGAGAAVA